MVQKKKSPYLRIALGCRLFEYVYIYIYIYNFTVGQAEKIEGSRAVFPPKKFKLLKTKDDHENMIHKDKKQKKNSYTILAFRRACH